MVKGEEWLFAEEVYSVFKFSYNTVQPGIIISPQRTATTSFSFYPLYFNTQICSRRKTWRLQRVRFWKQKGCTTCSTYPKAYPSTHTLTYFPQLLMLESKSLLSRLFSTFLYTTGGEADWALCAAIFNGKGRPSTS